MSYHEDRRKQMELERKSMVKRVVGFGTLGVVSIVALGIFFGSWYRVDEGERAVVLTNGSFSYVAAPGLNFKIPFFQSARFISIRNEVGQIEKLEAYSYDQQVANMRVSVNFSATDVEKIYSEYGSLDAAAQRIIYPKIYQQVKIVFGKFSAQRAIQERDKFNAEVLAAVQQSTNGSGLQVISVQIEDITFSPSYTEAVESAATAKQEVEKAKQTLLRVEQEAQQKVKQAQAEAEAKRLQADADAYATKAAGQATAEAIRERGSALRDNPQLVDLVAAEKWNGQLPTTMVPGSTVPFINMNDVAGSK